MAANPNIIYLSFKNNKEEQDLKKWIEDKSIKHGNKSNYIKYILKKEKDKEEKRLAKKNV